jgi:pimeloyl-ACP methyl ester carboxylesterase
MLNDLVFGRTRRKFVSGFLLAIALVVFAGSAPAQMTSGTESLTYTYSVDAPFVNRASTDASTHLDAAGQRIDPYSFDIPRFDPALGSLLRIHFNWRMETVGSRTCSVVLCRVAFGQLNFATDAVDTDREAFVDCTDLDPGNTVTCAGVFAPYGINFPQWAQGTSAFSDLFEYRSTFTLSTVGGELSYLTRSSDKPESWELRVLPELNIVSMDTITRFQLNAVARITVEIRYEYVKSVRVRVLNADESAEVLAIAADGRAFTVLEVSSDVPGRFIIQPNFDATNNNCNYRPHGQYGWSLDGSITEPDQGYLKKSRRLIAGLHPMSTLRIKAAADGGGWEYVGKAIYWAPSKFSELDCASVTRTVPLTVLGYTEGGSLIGETRVGLNIVRPPAILVHGWASNEDIFDNLEARMRQRAFDPALVTRADYRKTACDDFRSNSHVIAQQTDRALQNAASKRVAAAAVDVVAHSLGGILAYAHSNDGGFVRYSEPEGRHEIHSLVALDTPWLGSDWANNSVARSLARLALCRSFSLGAMDDLQPESAGLDSVLSEPANVPIFTVAGLSTSWPKIVAAAGGATYVLQGVPLLNVIVSATAISGVASAPVSETQFGDIVVSQCSQRGGRGRVPMLQRDHEHFSATAGFLTGPYDSTPVIDAILARWSIGVYLPEDSTNFLNPYPLGLDQCE